MVIHQAGMTNDKINGKISDYILFSFFFVLFKSINFKAILKIFLYGFSVIYA